MFGLREHVAGNRELRIGACKITVNLYVWHIQRIKREHIVVEPQVVPWRARTIVSIVVTAHIFIAGKPFGVIV